MITQVIQQLRDTHKAAKDAAWEGGIQRRAANLEVFNVAAFNHLPYLMDRIDEYRKAIDSLQDRLAMQLNHSSAWKSKAMIARRNLNRVLAVLEPIKYETVLNAAAANAISKARVILDEAISGNEDQSAQ